MTRLYLVRHAKAGERRAWDRPDVERPLSKKGWKQSAALATALAKRDPADLVSSPYVRCVQTLEPLGERLGIPVTVDDRLAEDRPLAPVLELLRSIEPRSVLCSHGDLIPAAIHELRSSGTTISSPMDWRKASVWILKRNRHGRIVTATVIPPPVV